MKENKREKREEKNTPNVLDEDFDNEMAVLDRDQQQANKRYAGTMADMAAELSAMSDRFAAELDSRNHGQDRDRGRVQDQGMRQQTDRDEAVRERKQGRQDVGSGKRVA